MIANQKGTWLSETLSEIIHLRTIQLWYILQCKKRILKLLTGLLRSFCNSTENYCLWTTSFYICVSPQEALLPGRRVFEDVSAPCSWTVLLWTWRKERRSPLGSRRDAQATAAPTVGFVRTKAAVWREPEAFPVTAARLPSLEPSVTRVCRLRPIRCGSVAWQKDVGLIVLPKLRSITCSRQFLIAGKCVTFFLNTFYILIKIILE